MQTRKGEEQEVPGLILLDAAPPGTFDAVVSVRDPRNIDASARVGLVHVHTGLVRGLASESIAEVARRYGFANPGRFITAYRSRFGETPTETARRRPG